MGTIKAIEDAYTQTKGYIVYDSFQTIMIALVLFLLLQSYGKSIRKTSDLVRGLILLLIGGK